MPNLLNEVHRLIEENKLRFALSRSGARKLRRAGVNLLAGRAKQKFMYSLTPKELGADFNIDTMLKTGSLPLVVDSEDSEATLAAYVQTYLREEIKAEALVRNLGGFIRCELPWNSWTRHKVWIIYLGGVYGKKTEEFYQRV